MNLDRLVRTFHDDYVMLSRDLADDVRATRDMLIDRIKTRLEQGELPPIRRVITQGSLAVNTMVRDLRTEAPDMDLDFGVVFDYDDVVSPGGNEYSARIVKGWIKEALDHGNLISAPRVRRNCVTLRYGAGEKLQVDVPVYRSSRLFDGSRFLELAGSSWRLSDPEGIQGWFMEKCRNSYGGSSSSQLRRMVRLFKVLGRSQQPALPGFFTTVLVTDNYVPKGGRDDHAFFLTGQRMMRQLEGTTRIRHPVLKGRFITTGRSDRRVAKYRDRLRKKIDFLSRAFVTGCTEIEAVSAWRYVFSNHPYFGEAVELAKS